MFSGICPWSPCDRASPRASVSTFGSMSGRPRAGSGARGPSGSPAPGRERTDSAPAGRRKGRPARSARPRARGNVPPLLPGRESGPRGPVQPRGFEPRGGDGGARDPAETAPGRAGSARGGRRRRGLGRPGRGSGRAEPRPAAQAAGREAAAAAGPLSQLRDGAATPALGAARGWGSAGVSGARRTSLLSAPSRPRSLARAVTSEAGEVPAARSRLLHASRGSRSGPGASGG